MKKKLTAQGPKDRKSYTVTLPLEWVKKEHLDETKLVDLTIVGNKAIVSAGIEKVEQIVVDCNIYGKVLKKVLPGFYRIGVKEIKLTNLNPGLSKITSDIIDKRLIGYEIVEWKNNIAIIKDVTKESEENFEILFRRIFLLILELSKCNNVAQAETLDRNIKKLINYCQRILMKKGHQEFRKTPIYYLILDRLEKLSDEFKWLLEKNIPNNNSVKLKELNLLLRKSYELFYKFNPGEFVVYQYRSYELKNSMKKIQKTSNSTIHSHNIFRILNSLLADIFTLRYNK